MPNLITVIVPVYKVEKYLDQCIESIVKQTYTNLEIILIDDGSSDRCARICDYWTYKDHRVHTIHKANGGLSSARNAGLDICTGKYITFVDSDDWINIDCISLMHSTLVCHNADICSANLVEYYEDTGSTRILSRKKFTAESEETLKKLYFHWEFPVGAAPKMYSSYIWRELRFPVGRIHEDVYTTYLAVDAAKRIVNVASAPYNYRVRPDSISTSKFTLKNLDLSDAWKTNYLFCKEKYPAVAPYAREAWLEHIPSLLASFPEKMTEEEKNAKRWLKGEIRDNIGFILLKMPAKKVYYQLKGLLFL